jgi:hypothetical protein
LSPFIALAIMNLEKNTPGRTHNDGKNVSRFP